MKIIKKNLPFILGCAILFSCNNSESKKSKIDEKIVDPTETLNADFQGENFSIPSPIQMSLLLKEANIPFNVMGNLIDLQAKVQNDYYWLENNFSQTKNNNYEKTQSNYKTEFALNWRLPVIRKSKANTVMIEPMANLVSTGYKKDFHKLPNEDGNDGELTFSNLFITDRIA